MSVLEKLEKRLLPEKLGGIALFTMEELCRAYWRGSKRNYIELAKTIYPMTSLIPQFEREDANRAASLARNRRPDHHR